MPDDAFARRRAAMVRNDLLGRGITDRRVLAAMGTVAREEFVPPGQARFAYDDRALPLTAGQTISQPYVVALMIEALTLQPSDRLLEIGSGSGYAAAVASRLCRAVIGLERVPALARCAAERLARLGFDNVRIELGDGSVGLATEAPFDAVLVSAGAPTLPTMLVEQLTARGRLVIPVGPARRAQRLVRVERHGDRVVERDLGAVAFVPLVGTQGWDEPDPS